MVAHDVDLLDLSRDAFLEDELQIDAVTRQWGDNSFDACAVFTDAVVEVFQSFFDIRQGCAVQRFTHTNTRCFKVLLEHIVFHRFVTGESDAGNRWAFFHLNQQRITITQDADVLKVASGKQCANGITDIFIINRVALANWHTEEGRTDGDTLKAFEMNILHYEPFSTVYGCAAKQQRRYEQLFHRHRCYAFFLTYPRP
ncbi:hypothetical protein D3C76_923510 [compost metagenome]